ncbi:MAG: hypothetical protein K2O61_10010 [Bacteroidaceae bacterium]|nr:hypothetical protein [Bacteroidaceae bacterium]
MTNIVPYWYYFLMASILFSYSNFVVFVIVMRKKAKELKTKVNDDKVKLEEKCAKLKKNIDDLMGTERISATLADDNSGARQA